MADEQQTQFISLSLELDLEQEFVLAPPRNEQKNETHDDPLALARTTPTSTAVTASLYVPTQNTLFIARSNGQIDVYKKIQAAKRVETPSLTLHGHGGPVYCLLWLERYSLLMSGSADRTIRAWDPFSPNKPQGTVVQTLVGHTGSVFSMADYGMYVFSSSADCTIRVWVASPGRDLLLYPFFSPYVVLRDLSSNPTESPPRPERAHAEATPLFLATHHITHTAMLDENEFLMSDTRGSQKSKLWVTSLSYTAPNRFGADGALFAGTARGEFVVFIPHRDVDILSDHHPTARDTHRTTPTTQGSRRVDVAPLGITIVGRSSEAVDPALNFSRLGGLTRVHSLGLTQLVHVPGEDVIFSIGADQTEGARSK
ncbi:hypothetical protein PAPYR_3720 [Paratrimastix pyriformis]|uniref:WD40 repeat-like protein n=1 Tax=Paratrimastix pyriformis TaxID=342808 RepID=A0ABQ8UR34_9EUKA|nr:hypothetical protein PAPYR_3720 [Paratrimastix pyriformis]